MKDQFPGYYPVSKETISALWTDGLFVFDTNVLLHFYRYSQAALNEWYRTLEAVKDRVWIPHQVALEYQRGRLKAIFDEKASLKKFDSEFRKKADQVTEFLAESRRFGKDPELAKWRDGFKKSLEAVSSKVQKVRDGHPDLMKQDVIRDRLEELFSGRVGQAFDEDKLRSLLAEGQVRFEQRVPPGFADGGKEYGNQYGDLILWNQILECAKARSRGVLFVTDDAKKDWWQIINDLRTPHPALLDEFSRCTGSSCFFYSAEDFLNEAKTRLKLTGDVTVAAEEAKSVSEEESNERAARIAALSELFRKNSAIETLLAGATGSAGYYGRTPELPSLTGSAASGFTPWQGIYSALGSVNRCANCGQTYDSPEGSLLTGLTCPKCGAQVF